MLSSVESALRGPKINHRNPCRCPFLGCNLTFATYQEACEHGRACQVSSAGNSSFPRPKFRYSRSLLQKASNVAEGLGNAALVLCCLPVWIVIEVKEMKQAKRNRALAELAELSAAEHKGYYAGSPEDAFEQQSTFGHSQKPSLAISEADSNVVGQRHSCNDSSLYPTRLAEPDEDSLEDELEAMATTLSQKNLRLSIVPIGRDAKLPFPR